ncbi:hypothetical protein [Shewanella donghaensis]|uniref:hypothetical protein n=1 Tax=Shewanella donghaensis TaxID=238836 RepID=UPI0011832355|nr:hypothetical protein [Shewanella donghaensis]
MPKAYPHSTIHSNYYYINVEHLLVDTIVEGLGRIGIIDVLQEVGEDLKDGTFEINKSLRG